MLDTVLEEALSHARRPPPTMIRPEAEIGESVASFKTRTEAQIEAIETAAKTWIAQGEVVRQQVSAGLRSAADHGVPVPDIIAMLDRMIAKIEEVARMGAADFDRMERSFRRQIEQARKLKLAEVGYLEQAMHRTMSSMQRELEERSDMALFLRTWRSEFSPGGRGGPVFDDPDALDRYLREAAAT